MCDLVQRMLCGSVNDEQPKALFTSPVENPWALHGRGRTRHLRRGPDLNQTLCVAEGARILRVRKRAIATTTVETWNVTKGRRCRRIVELTRFRLGRVRFRHLGYGR